MGASDAVDNSELRGVFSGRGFGASCESLTCARLVINSVLCAAGAFLPSSVWSSLSRIDEEGLDGSVDTERADTLGEEVVAYGVFRRRLRAAFRGSAVEWLPKESPFGS